MADWTKQKFQLLAIKSFSADISLAKKIDLKEDDVISFTYWLKYGDNYNYYLRMYSGSVESFTEEVDVVAVSYGDTKHTHTFTIRKPMSIDRIHISGYVKGSENDFYFIFFKILGIRLV